MSSTIEIEPMEHFERQHVRDLIAECGGAEEAVSALLDLFGTAYQAAAWVTAGDDVPEHLEEALLDALANPTDALRRGQHMVSTSEMRPARAALESKT